MNGVSRTRRFLRFCLMAMLVLGFAGLQATANEHDIRFTTEDGIIIAATVNMPTAGEGSFAAVVFIHQGGSSRSEWVTTRLFDSLAEHKIVAFAYDVRGHGDSAGEADFNTLFDDPRQAPKDLQAALEWLRLSGRVDMSRIAIVGASIGANLACVAAGSELFSIKTAVAISGKVAAVHNLAGGEDKLSDLRSVFLIAAELEQDGKRAAWASELYEATAAPRQLEIIAGSSSHGVSIFNDEPMLQQRILDWLLSTL